MLLAEISSLNVVKCLSQLVVAFQYSLSPIENLLTRCRKFRILMATFNQLDAELFFELLYRVGQGGLCDVANLRGTSEMLFLCQSHKEEEVFYQHEDKTVI